MSKVVETFEAVNPWDIFTKDVNEYSIEELMSLKHDVLDNIAYATNNLIHHEDSMKREYNKAMVETIFEDVISTKPSEASKKAYCEMQSADNRLLMKQDELEVDMYQKQLDIINNLLCFHTIRLENFYKDDG